MYVLVLSNAPNQTQLIKAFFSLNYRRSKIDDFCSTLLGDSVNEKTKHRACLSSSSMGSPADSQNHLSNLFVLRRFVATTTGI